MVKMASQLLGTKAMLQDLGVSIKLKILTDASAAQGIAARRGLGQVRHIEVSTLWLQDQVNKNRIQIEKVKGTENLADPMTKHTGNIDHEVFTKGTEIEFRKGRHELAPQVESGIDPTNCENEEENWEPGGKPHMESRVC